MPKDITVYVRLAPSVSGRRDDDEDQAGRVLTFKRVPEIPTAELLNRGLPIDGNQVRLEVYYDSGNGSGFAGTFGYTSPLVDFYYDTLSSALVETEKKLVEWLGQHDYQVTFA